MLLAEHARTLDVAPTIQVFASDLDEHAVQTARDGVYPAAIEADVSPERLRRYFVKEHGSYRVRRELRETVLFATHDHSLLEARNHRIVYIDEGRVVEARRGLKSWAERQSA